MRFYQLLGITNWLTNIKVFDYDTLFNDVEEPVCEDSQQAFMNREVKTITCLGKHDMSVVLGK